VAFATPPVVTHALAVAPCDYIQSVVYHHDVVPRASLANFEQLRQEMLSQNWESMIETELKSNKAFELAIKARKSLEDALTDGGIWVSGERATRAIASAWAGARAAIPAKLGGTPQESASVGAAVGSGVETARSVVEDEGGKESGSKADDVGESGGAAGTHSEGGDSGSGKGKPEGEEAAGQSEEKQGYIPRLYAPGELLYLRTTPGESAEAPVKYQLIRATPQEQRFERIILSVDMVNHHRATSYIEAIEGVARGLGIEIPAHPT